MQGQCSHDLDSSIYLLCHQGQLASTSSRPSLQPGQAPSLSFSSLLIHGSSTAVIVCPFKKGPTTLMLCKPSVSTTCYSPAYSTAASSLNPWPMRALKVQLTEHPAGKSFLVSCSRADILSLPLPQHLPILYNTEYNHNYLCNY